MVGGEVLFFFFVLTTTHTHALTTVFVFLHRLLASDMRSVLCSALDDSKQTRSHHNDSASCDALLNMASWTMDKFLKAYSDSTFAELLSPSLRARLAQQNLSASLLELNRHMMGLETGTSPDLQDVLQRPDEDYLLWSGPDAPAWVACNQRNNTCYGKISKSQWYSSRENRAKVCTDAFSEQARLGNVNSTAVGLDVCNLNRQTDEMCQVRALLQMFFGFLFNYQVSNGHAQFLPDLVHQVAHGYVRQDPLLL